MKEKKDKLTEQWTDRPGPDPGKPSAANENLESKCYGLAGEMPLYLDIICRNGHDLGLPYSSLPHIEFVPDPMDPQQSINLVIMDFEYEVIVKGRSLLKLKKHLRTGKLAFIRESPTTTDDGLQDVFIEKIDIQRRKS